MNSFLPGASPGPDIGAILTLEPDWRDVENWKKRKETTVVRGRVWYESNRMDSRSESANTVRVRHEMERKTEKEKKRERERSVEKGCHWDKNGMTQRTCDELSDSRTAAADTGLGLLD